MIKINLVIENNTITKIIQDEIEKQKEKIYNGKKRKNNKILKRESQYDDIIEKIFENLEIIVSGKIEDVLIIYNNLQKEFPEILYEIDGKSEMTEKQEEFKNYISNIFDFNKIIGKSNIAYSIATVLNVSVCPYCNRQYITTVNTKTGKTRPEFDHFFPKSKFPLLSLTLSNLIPSCSTCNKIKKDKFFCLEKNLYPYNEGIEDIKYFSYLLNSYNNTEIKLNKNINKKMDNNAEQLLLEDIYKTHNIVVNDIIDNYNKINETIKTNNFEMDFSDNDVKRILGYTDKENLKDTSLGKFKNDIIEEILNTL